MKNNGGVFQENTFFFHLREICFQYENKHIGFLVVKTSLFEIIMVCVLTRIQNRFLIHSSECFNRLERICSREPVEYVGFTLRFRTKIFTGRFSAENSLSMSEKSLDSLVILLCEWNFSRRNLEKGTRRESRADREIWTNWPPKRLHLAVYHTRVRRVRICCERGS